MMLEAGRVVQIEDRRCGYRISSSVPVEGGGYRLELIPTEPPYLLEIQEVYWRRDAWRTEQLEEVMVDGTPAPKGTEPCQTCGAPIRWSWTKTGKKTPVNPDGTSHWGTCPQAQEWRGKTRSEPVTDSTEVIAFHGQTPQSAGEKQLSLF